MFELLFIIKKALTVYMYILFARLLLTWLPSIDWYRQPFRFMRDITDPLLEPFRRLVPPIGGIDISPILLFLLIQLVIGLLPG